MESKEAPEITYNGDDIFNGDIDSLDGVETSRLAAKSPSSLVTVSKEFNRTSLSALNKSELNLFFAILAQRYYTDGDGVAIVSFKDMMIASGMRYILNRTKMRNEIGKEFITKMTSMSLYNHLYITINDETEPAFVSTPVFDQLFWLPTSDRFAFSINAKAAAVMNKSENNYVATNFADFQEIGTKQGKLLYRRMQEFRDTKWLYMSKEDLYDCFGIKTPINSSMLKQRYIDPATSELLNIYPYLRVEPRREGRNVIGYKFTWKEPKITNSELIIKGEFAKGPVELALPTKLKIKLNAFFDYEKASHSSYDEIIKMNKAAEARARRNAERVLGKFAFDDLPKADKKDIVEGLIAPSIYAREHGIRTFKKEDDDKWFLSKDNEIKEVF